MSASTLKKRRQLAISELALLVGAFHFYGENRFAGIDTLFAVRNPEYGGVKRALAVLAFPFEGEKPQDEAPEAF